MPLGVDMLVLALKNARPIIKSSYSTSTGATYVLAYTAGYLLIKNDHGTTPITLTVNGLTITIKALETFEGYFEGFTTFAVAGAVAQRIYVGV